MKQRGEEERERESKWLETTRYAAVKQLSRPFSFLLLLLRGSFAATLRFGLV